MTEKQNDQPPAKSRRRWFQYGLRTFLVLIVVLGSAAAWVGVLVNGTRQEDRVVLELRASQGARSLNLLYANPYKESDGVGEMEMLFQGGPEWMTDLLGTDLFRTVTSIQCYAPGNSFSYGVNDEGMLQITRDYKTGLSDDEMQLVARLPNLKQLFLEAHPVGDAGVTHLRKMRKLETLHLGNTTVSDQALVTLAELPKLSKLDVSQTHVSDAAIETIAEFPALVEINVELTRVSDEGVARLRQLRPDLQITH